MPESLTAGEFSEHVGGVFRVHLDDREALEVELISAEKRGEEDRPFSLIFRGPNEVHLPQRTYRMEQAELGSLDIFLVPIGPDGAGMLYEAVFN